MRRIHFLIVLCFTALCITNVCAQSVESRKLSIQEMFDLAEKNNSRIKAHTTAIQEAEAGIKVAKNAWLPAVDASLSLSYNGNSTIADRNFGNSFRAEIPDFGNNFALEVAQVIYSGGSIKNSVKLSELQAQLAALDADRNRQEVRFFIVGNYLELCKLDNQLEVFDAHIRQTEKVLNDMRIRHEQGTALHNDITRYELQLQNLSYARTQVENNRRILNDQLNVALGFPQNVSIRVDSIGIDDIQGKSLQNWKDEAEFSSIPVQIAEKTIRLNEHKKNISHAERLPKVALFAFDRLDGPITIEIPAINKNFNYWGVGIGISYNFGNLYKTNKKTKADKLSIQRANEQLQVTREETALAMQAAYIKYMEAYTLLDTKLKSVELADQNYKVIDYRYRNELALITDLLDASSQKLDTELQTVNARVNILYNYYKLRYISGTL